MTHTQIEAPPVAHPQVRDARRFRRYAAAVILPIPAALIAIGPLIRPGYGLEDNGEAILENAAHPTAAALSNWLGVVTVLLIVPALLAAVRLGRRRRPVLATVTAAINLVAYVAAAYSLFSIDIVLEVAGRPGFDPPSLAPFVDATFEHPATIVGVLLFVVGHIVGAVLLGLLLRGIVPTWAWVAILVSQPLHFVAFVIVGNAWLDVASWGLMAAGLAACAVAVLRTSDDDWDLAPLR